MARSKSKSTKSASTTNKKSKSKAKSRSKSKVSRDERLVVRRMKLGDIGAIRRLQERCFPGVAPWREDQLRNHIRVFPEGQIVVELDGELVATSSSMLVEGASFLDPHTYKQVSDHGNLGTHDPEGDTLYGLDIAVDPTVRGFRISRRIYDARKQLVRDRKLRAIMIGGRAPGFKDHDQELSFGDYVQAVVAKELRDPTVTAQLANGFTIRRTLPGY
ncbi:MAG: GNAT family N-acetyltransferase, partial [Nannocystaceae bacterium]